MSIFDQKQLLNNYIKVRWKEPYVSEALNKKDFGSKPRGVYSGFNIVPIGYRSYRVEGTTPTGFEFQGNPEEYARGAFDATSGFSIATFSDNFGHETSVVIPPGSVSGEFDFDFTGEDNTQKIIALDVEYLLSNETTGRVVAVDSAEIDANPDYIVLGVINLPDVGVSGSASDIDFQDLNHPRILPFATPFKYGYMSPQQALAVANIGDEVDAIYCSTDDAEVWWRNIDVSGVDVGRLDFTGTIVYNQPTADWNLHLTSPGLTVSGIEEGDVLFFQYPTDGSVSAVDLQIAPNNDLPLPPVGYQTSIFGIRCSNDFWFKNGQKWEVGESKPFGVTSKFPNLTIGETGNPPVAEGVSGIFFDNAQVDIQPGGKDVRIFVNVSGALPNQPIEEEIVVTNVTGECNFTVTDPNLFWVFDDERVDVKIFQNGVKLTQYTTDTSGVTLSDNSPIWHWRKTGTRSFELRDCAPKDAVLTVMLEANRSLQALEQTFLVDQVSGQDIFTSVYPFSSDNDVHDITVFRNGVKVQYENTLIEGIHGGQKISESQFQFIKNGNPFFLPKDSVVTIRHEGGNAVPSGSVSGGGGDFWFTPVDENIIPDTDNAYDLGSSSKGFRNGHFSQDVSVKQDVYIGGKLNVSGGIDPLWMQFDPIDPSVVSVPPNSLFVDSTAGNALTYKDNNSIDNPLIQTSSGISVLEDEVMLNPYPFNIEAPRAVSLSTSGNTFLLTDFDNPDSVNNFFGILTENVSANMSAPIKWRGKLPISGLVNGAVFVSGTGSEGGTLVQDSPSVSGTSILRVGVAKSNTLFIRPSESISL